MGAIEKGAQERMEALRAKKERLEMGKSVEETVPKLIGHIEKVEEEEPEEGVEGSGVVQKKGDDGMKQKIMKGTTVGEKEGVQQPEEQAAGTEGSTKEDSKKKPRSTPSAARLKEEKRRARIKEQERRWKEATEKGLGEREGDIDLEDAMMSPEEGEKQTEKTKKNMEESDTYGKVYTKMHEKGQNKAYHEQSEKNRKNRRGGRKYKKQEPRRKRISWHKRKQNVSSRGRS